VHPTRFVSIEEIRVDENVPTLWRPHRDAIYGRAAHKGGGRRLRKCDVDVDAGLITVRRS